MSPMTSHLVPCGQCKRGTSEEFLIQEVEGNLIRYRCPECQNDLFHILGGPGGSIQTSVKCAQCQLFFVLETLTPQVKRGCEFFDCPSCKKLLATRGPTDRIRAILKRMIVKSEDGRFLRNRNLKKLQRFKKHH